MEAQRAYLRAVLDGCVSGAAGDPKALAQLARRARTAWTDAESAVKLARSEPRHGEQDLRAAAATLSALRRAVYGVHALRLEAGTAPPEPLPELAPLADALDEALATIAGALEGGAAPPLPPMRQLYRALPELPEGIRVSLDELIDAIDTLAASIGLTLP